VVVARSEIRVVRRVGRELAVGMFQQYSSASNCTLMQAFIVMKEHYTICQHSTTLFQMALCRFLVFYDGLMTLLWSLIA
jgi:uncharacterized protein affecting Mg2+/Co2+ transport